MFLPNGPRSLRQPTGMAKSGGLLTPFHLIELAIALAIVGLGIDYARAWLAGMQLQAASDFASVAALTTGPRTQGDNAEIERVARNAVRASLHAQGDVASLTTRRITVRHAAALPSVSVVVEGTVPTLFLSIVGYENLSVMAKSVARFRQMPKQ